MSKKTTTEIHAKSVKTLHRYINKSYEMSKKSADRAEKALASDNAIRANMPTNLCVRHLICL